MPVIAAPTGGGARLGRRGSVAIVGVAVAGALSVATFSSPRFAHVLGEGFSASVQGVKTVAAMLAERSPGQRPEGALAQLKHKRAAALHERALPKVRGPAPTAYEALAGPAPSPPIAPPPEAPLFATLAGGPTPPALGAVAGPGPRPANRAPPRSAVVRAARGGAAPLLPASGGAIRRPADLVHHPRTRWRRRIHSADSNHRGGSAQPADDS